MQIHDRGNMKWTAMMLPEHKEALKKQTDELLNDVEKPVLNEDKLEEFDIILNKGIMEGKLIKFWIYLNKRIKTVEGHIKKTKPVEGYIQVKVQDGQLLKISIDSIVDMQFIE